MKSFRWAFVKCRCRPVQLLEDVEDTLNCTAFEEDSLYRKLNCKCMNMSPPLHLLMSHFKDAWLFVSSYLWLEVALHHVGWSWTRRPWGKSIKQLGASELHWVCLCWLRKLLSAGFLPQQHQSSFLAVHSFVHVVTLPFPLQRRVGKHPHGSETWATLLQWLCSLHWRYACLQAVLIHPVWNFHLVNTGCHVIAACVFRWCVYLWSVLMYWSCCWMRQQCPEEWRWEFCLEGIVNIPCLSRVPKLVISIL